MANINDELNKTADAANRAKNNVENLSNSVNQSSNAMNANNQVLQNLSNTMHSVAGTTSNVSKSIGDITSSLRSSLGNVINNIRNSVQGTGQTVNQSIAEISARVNNMNSEFQTTNTSAGNGLAEIGARLREISSSINQTTDDIQETGNSLNDISINYDAIDEYNQRLQNAIDNMEDASRQARELSSDISSVGGTTGGAPTPPSGGSNINQSVQNATAFTQQQIQSTLSVAMNAVNQFANNFRQGIANIIKIVRAANKVVNSFLKGIINIAGLAASGLEKILQVFGNLGNRVKNSDKQVNIFRNTFTELNSAIQLVSGAINSVFNNEFINQAEKLYSTIQSLNVMIGTNATRSTIEWAESLERAVGISASDLITNLREISSVMYGLGMSSKDVSSASKNLEVIGLKLSAISGLDYETVMKKLQSGMKGMTQSVDDLGISVRASQMDVFLEKLRAKGVDLGTSFKNLSEEQRVYVRYAAIVDQVMSKQAYSASNFNAVMHSVTGQLNILRSQFNQIKTTIGLFGMALIKNLIMPMTYVVYTINQLIQQLAKFLGFSLDLRDALGEAPSIEIGDGVEDLTDDLEENAEAAEKAKGALDAWDHVSTMTTSKNKGATGAFDPSSLIGDIPDLGDELTKFTDDYIEQCKKKFDELIQYIKDKIMNITSDLVKSLTGRSIDWSFISNNLKTVVDNIKKTFINLFNTIKNIAKIAFATIWSIGDDLDFSLLLAKFTGLIERITKLMSVVTEKIQKPIQDMYDKYISKYVVRLGDFIEQQLDRLTAKFNEWIKWWEDDANKGKINSFFDNIGENIEKVIVSIITLIHGYEGLNDEDRKVADNATGGWKGLILIADNLHNVISLIVGAIRDLLQSFGILDEKGEASFEGISNAISKAFEKITTFVNNILIILQELIVGNDNLSDKAKETEGAFTGGWASISSIAKSLHEILVSVFGDIDIASILDTIQEKLKEFAEWLDKNKDKISALLKDTLDTLTKLTELKFEVITGLINLLVENQETISNVLKVLQAVIDLAIKHPKLAITITLSGLIIGAAIKTVLKLLFYDFIKTQIANAIAGAMGGTATQSIIGKIGTSIGTKLSSIFGQSAAQAGAAQVTGAGTASTTAGVGGTTVGSTIAGASIGTAALGSGIIAAEVVALGVAISKEKEEIQRNWRDMFANLNNSFGEFVNNKGQKEQITSEQTKQWAFDIRESLEAVYGTKVPDEAFRQSLDGLEARLKANGEYTDEQMSAIKQSVEDNYNTIGNIDIFDKWAYSDGLDTFFSNTQEKLSQVKEDLSQKADEFGANVETFFDNLRELSLEDITNTFNSIIESVQKFFSDRVIELETLLENITSTIKSWANARVTDAGTLINNIVAKIASKLPLLFNAGKSILNSLLNGFKSVWNNISTWVKEKTDWLAKAFDNSVFGSKTEFYSRNNIGISQVRGVTTRAEGGSIKSGSLALINENGNSEILGNFGGYTGVANNKMIIEAMQSALLQAFKQANIGNNGGTVVNNIEISKGGIFAGDDASIRNLANRLDKITNNSKRTIANTSFRMA